VCNKTVQQSAVICDCGTVTYCSVKCQNADFIQHKSSCTSARLPFKIGFEGVRVAHLPLLFAASKTANLTTRQVVANLILPLKKSVVKFLQEGDATAKKQVKEKADVYVVHAWDGLWDDLVTTLLESGSPDRYVCFDDKEKEQEIL